MFHERSRWSRRGDDINDARRKTDFLTKSAQREGGERRKFRGFQPTVLPVASAGAIFQASISRGKFTE